MLSYLHVCFLDYENEYGCNGSKFRVGRYYEITNITDTYRYFYSSGNLFVYFIDFLNMSLCVLIISFVNLVKSADVWK